MRAGAAAFEQRAAFIRKACPLPRRYAITMARITTGMLPGPAGELEFVLHEPDAGTAFTRAAVACHPHPLFGGTLHSRTIFQAARSLAALGLPVLRFNFRGAGRSQGRFDQGQGETQDLRAALDFAFLRWGVPIVLAGFSFGSFVALGYLQHHADARLQRLLAIGVPANDGHLPSSLAWNGPKLFISGTADQFGAVPAVEAYVASLPEPKRLCWLEGADHFLTGRGVDYDRLIRQNLDFA